MPLRFIEIEKYLNIIDLQPEFDERGKGGFKSGDIEIKNLSFKYPKSEGLVLDDINLIIKEGTRVAFVGHSGSGKTTITKLLMRAYDYTHQTPPHLPVREEPLTGSNAYRVVPLSYGEGLGGRPASTPFPLERAGDRPEPSITIAGIELRDIGSHDLRSHIGYVEQHVDLFDTTVRENILMGVDEKTLNKWSKQKAEIENVNMLEYKLEEVAKLSRIDEFYHRLGDNKFDTQIGERGIKLSGGERQRVGIARAIIKDPAILIFDEATSALDTVNEKYIKEAIDNVSRGRTTIIIAHRLSTVQDADMIIVMDKGKIVATGTHNDLLSSSTHYQELIQAQLK